MKVGFSGTQSGMSEDQREALRYLMVFASELHHGDCVGADAEADAIARELEVAVVIHPPVRPDKRAFCARSGDAVREPRQYLERNRDIVNETDLLVAAPRTSGELVRSGTWATVRYARSAGRDVMVLPRVRSDRELTDAQRAWLAVHRRAFADLSSDFAREVAQAVTSAAVRAALAERRLGS